MYYVIECQDTAPDACAARDYTQDYCVIQTFAPRGFAEGIMCDMDINVHVRAICNSRLEARMQCAQFGYGGAFGHYAIRSAPPMSELIEKIYWGPEGADSALYLGPHRDYDSPGMRLHGFLFEQAPLADYHIYDDPKYITQADIKSHAERLHEELTVDGYWGFGVVHVEFAIRHEITIVLDLDRDE